MSRLATFEDVSAKYHQARDCMFSNQESALAGSYPAHAPWINSGIMRIWLYGSSVEFLADYTRLQEAAVFQGEEKDLAAKWRAELQQNLTQFKNNLRANFPHENKLMGVIDLSQ